MTAPKTYPPAEERLNILTHAAGLAASLVALGLLLRRGWVSGSGCYFFSQAVFGFSLVALYAASTLYHRARDPRQRQQLKIADHAAIYLLIAGTYTPFTLVTLRGPVGWTIFAVVWGLAGIGIVLKLFFAGRHPLLSTSLYVFLGWIIIFAFKPLKNSLPPAGLHWLLAGGISYTVGALLYSLKKLKFSHAIFHLFVLAGSFCHFMAVFLYVVPGS